MYVCACVCVVASLNSMFSSSPLSWDKYYDVTNTARQPQIRRDGGSVKVVFSDNWVIKGSFEELVCVKRLCVCYVLALCVWFFCLLCFAVFIAVCVCLGRQVFHLSQVYTVGIGRFLPN